MTPTELARFEAKVHPEPNTGCWLWLGAADKYGYGSLAIRDESGRMMSRKAHRLSYEHHIGPIPDELPLDHVRRRGCCGPACVNPAHLEAVTQRENVQRGAELITHCPRGHAYTAENTYYSKTTGGRKCRECHRVTRRKGQAEQTQERIAEACRLRTGGHSVVAIGQVLGVSRQAVYQMLAR